jgi:hypothetical protein
MVQLIQNKNTYRIVLTNNKKVNVQDVYNRVFFSSFGLEGIRIYGFEMDNKNQEIEEVQNTTPQIVNNKFIDVFGKEQPFNGYSELPLPNKSEMVYDSDVDEGVYGFFREYISNYSNNSKKTNSKLNDNRIEISIPLDINFPVLYLNNMYSGESNPLFHLSEKNITYDALGKIIRDIYLQIIYLAEKGYYYNEIPIDSVFLIQNKNIIFSMETLVEFDENNTEQLQERNNAILKFIQILLGSSDTKLGDILEKIQYTNLYYFIKRVQDESVLVYLG